MRSAIKKHQNRHNWKKSGIAGLLAITFGIGNVMVAYADSSTTPNLSNASLPLPEIPESTVESIMSAPSQVSAEAKDSQPTPPGAKTKSSEAPKASAEAKSSEVGEQDISTAVVPSVTPELSAATTAGGEAVGASSEEVVLDSSANDGAAILTNKTTTDSSPPPPGSALFSEKISYGLPAGSILGRVERDEFSGSVGSGSGPVVVDNDQAEEVKETIKYKELPTDEGKTKVLMGATFPVVISSQITSKTAKPGDAVDARLKYDLKIGDRLVATKGSIVRGHLNYVLKARSVLHSMVTTKRWYRNSGCIGVSFDELINEKGEHIPLVATPSQTSLIVKNKYEGRVLGVNHNGQITGPWSQQLRYKAIRIGLNFALAPAGVFSFGAMPVALGVIGAVNPSFAFMKPVGQNVRHRRIKGFAWGFLSGIPGSWLIEDTVVKGQEAVMMPGDELLAEFKQEFTGEPVTDANLMPGANTKVHGQVVPEEEKKKKK